jgi:NADPH:quinone reductase-like Zn-dependent oxidoreductase
VVTGINASDVNFSSGKYQGSPTAAKAQMPFTAGFESVGVVCKAGTSSGEFVLFTITGTEGRLSSALNLPGSGSLQKMCVFSTLLRCAVAFKWNSAIVRLGYLQALPFESF